MIGRLVTLPNILHHYRPTYFTRHSWLRSAEVLTAIGIVIVATAWALDWLTWQVVLFVCIGVNANEVHKWNHLPRARRPKLIAGLQAARILQTAEHHTPHHTGQKNRAYCVLANLLNPVLDAVGLWRLLEGVVAAITGVPRRKDPSLAMAPTAPWGGL